MSESNISRRNFILGSLSLLVSTSSIYANTNSQIPTTRKRTLDDSFMEIYEELSLEHGLNEGSNFLVINGGSQELYNLNYSNDNITIKNRYPVSTSKYGFGNIKGSDKTPTGVHKIKYKIGNPNNKDNMIFKARESTGKNAEINKNVDEDLVTSIILWLDGQDKPEDLNTNYFSDSRLIYIHGTNNERDIGKPVSDGCIRMKNDDIRELFNKVGEGSIANGNPEKGTLVYITEKL